MTVLCMRCKFWDWQNQDEQGAAYCSKKGNHTYGTGSCSEGRKRPYEDYENKDKQS